MNDRVVDAAPKIQPAGAPAPAPAPTTTDESASNSNEGSIKETIESIIVAFILAFVFRGFVVEAFVIPTGSMATTLLGAHMRFDCPDCGYGFDVNYASESGDPDEVNIPSVAQLHDNAGRVYNRVFAIYCPNCGYKLPRVDPADPTNDATAPPVRYGDRILVLKYVYLASRPQRWDVVVFKSPDRPERFDYGQNYIKRLVGLPGEAIFILDGDIYVGRPDAPPDRFVVQAKPDHVQDVLWRIVYDNDYPARGLGHWVQPWVSQAGETGWETRGRDFTFDNLRGASTLRFDASANPDKHALTDWLAYDVTAPQQDPNRRNREPLPQLADSYHVRSYDPHNNVSDLRLSFYYDRRSGDGPLSVEMSKLDHTFTARLTPQGAQLLMRRGTGEAVPVGDVVALNPPRGGRGVHVELINADYQVRLLIDGREVARTTPEQYHPDIAHLLDMSEKHERMPKPEVRITAERQIANFSHVQLWRDVYYLNRSEGQGGGAVRWGRPPNLTPDLPGGVMTLGRDEFFVLGDNSLLSGDARTWDQHINLPDEDLYAEDGRVPGRFMIGKAFFVYWPAGYRPLQRAPALIPNFGDMRFIH